VDFKLENVLVSLHCFKTMGSAPLFLRNGELLRHSSIRNNVHAPQLSKQNFYIVNTVFWLVVSWDRVHHSYLLIHQVLFFDFAGVCVSDLLLWLFLRVDNVVFEEFSAATILIFHDISNRKTSKDYIWQFSPNATLA
jgi:hypothetical protein